MTVIRKISKLTYHGYQREAGMIHYVLPLIVIIGISIIGVGYLVETHADSTTVTAGSLTGSYVSGSGTLGSDTLGSTTGSYVVSSPNAPSANSGSAIAGSSTIGSDTLDAGYTGSDTSGSDTISTAVGSATVDTVNVACAAQGNTSATAKHLTGPHGGTYWLNPNRYGGGDQCPRNTDSKTDFTVFNGGVTKRQTSSVQAFPDIIVGCTTKACIAGSGFPKRVSNLNPGYHASSIGGGTGAAGKWDEVYDLWFNRTDHFGQSRGTEVLIMFNRKNLPPPAHYFAKGIDIPIDGAEWTEYTSVQHVTINRVKYAWNFIQFRRNTATNSVSDLNLIHFMDDAEGADCAQNSPCLNRNWYWTGGDVGYELWFEGYGLSYRNVAVAP